MANYGETYPRKTRHCAELPGKKENISGGLAGPEDDSRGKKRRFGRGLGGLSGKKDSHSAAAVV